MGLFSSSKSSSATNITDQRIGAEGGSIVARNSTVNITDFNAFATAGAVAVNTSRKAAETAKAALSANNEVSKRAISESLGFGSEALRESYNFGNETNERAFEFGGSALGFADTTVFETLNLVQEQQDANVESQKETSKLSFAALKGIVDSTKTSGERSVRLIIIFMGAVGIVIASSLWKRRRKK